MYGAAVCLSLSSSVCVLSNLSSAASLSRLIRDFPRSGTDVCRDHVCAFPPVPVEYFLFSFACLSLVCRSVIECICTALIVWPCFKCICTQKHFLYCYTYIFEYVSLLTERERETCCAFSDSLFLSDRLNDGAETHGWCR